MLALIPLGYSVAGFAGAVAGIAASDSLRYAVSAFAALRAGLRGWLQDLRLTAWMLATAALGWWCAELAQRRGAAPLAIAALVFAVVTLAWTPPAVSLWLAKRRERPLEF
jgi:hypothetical protein